MKQYRSRLVLSSLLLLLPIVAGLLLWNRLPAEIATHFGPDNLPDGYSGKIFTVLGIPAFLLAVHWLCLFATLHDPKKSNVGSKMLSLLFWLVPMISLITMGLIYGNALGMALNPGLIANLLVGVVFLIIGNYMGKTHQNYTVGIKLPWTLHSTENWNRTHRLGGICFVAGGLLLLLNAWLLLPWLLLLVLLLVVILPVIYSYSLYKKGV